MNWQTDPKDYIITQFQQNLLHNASKPPWSIMEKQSTNLMTLGHIPSAHSHWSALKFSAYPCKNLPISFFYIEKYQNEEALWVQRIITRRNQHGSYISGNLNLQVAKFANGWATLSPSHLPLSPHPTHFSPIYEGRSLTSTPLKW